MNEQVTDPILDDTHHSATRQADATVLSVEHLAVDYGGVPALEDLTFHVMPGEAVGIVGESGSGKSTLGRAILGLLPHGGEVVSGAIFLDGRDLTTLHPNELHRLRGSEMGLVPQDPLRSLNPVRRTKAQIEESLRLDPTLTARDRTERARALLDSVGIADVDRVMQAFPHQLSGGMRQRVAIAASLARGPKLLIADESTTALDVTVQQKVLGVLEHARTELGLALVLISHDLNLVAERVDRVIVMRNGRIVEQGPVQSVLGTPQHEYTKTLIAASRALSTSTNARTSADPARTLLDAAGITVTFGSGRRRVEAVRDVSLTVAPGQTLAVVGESGSGKSTLGRVLVRMIDPSSGTLRWNGGTDLLSLEGRPLRRWRAHVQLIAQDPIASFDPRLPVVESIAEAARTHRPLTHRESRATARALLVKVGLDEALGQRIPSKLSGGQAQRSAIAKALAVEPQLLVLDEPTSALDVSVQAQIIELLESLQHDLNLSYVFISHDLGLVKRLAHHVIVMRHGEAVEAGPSEAVLDHPRNAYTQELLAAAPRGLDGRETAKGAATAPAEDLRTTSVTADARPRPTIQGVLSSYWARRLLLAAFTVWGGCTIVFLVTRMLWDPVARLAGPYASQDDIAALRESLGYDRPLFLQYLDFLGRFFTGTFPNSLTFDTPPVEIIADRLAPSLVLAATTLVLAVIVGGLMGYVAGVRRGKLLDRVVAAYVVFAQSTPDFVLGPLFILLAGVTWRLLPVSGLDEPLALILPVLTLAIFPIAEIAVVLRSSVIETTGAEHLVFARARGIPERSIAVSHVLRVSLLPTITVIGLTAIEILTGVVVVEVIFGIPGFGSLVQEAVSAQDIPLVEACVVLIAVAVAITMLLIELVNRAVDPRLRTR